MFTTAHLQRLGPAGQHEVFHSVIGARVPSRWLWLATMRTLWPKLFRR